MDPRRRRHRHRRHHRSRAGAARRHGLCRAARASARPGEGRRGGRRRERESRKRSLRAGLAAKWSRSTPTLEASPGTVNEDPAGQRLVLQDEHQGCGRARRTDERGAIPGIREVDLLKRALARWQHEYTRHGGMDARRRGVLRRPLQPRPCLALRWRHRGCGIVLAVCRAVADVAGGRGRSRGGVRRGAVELPHADLPRHRGARKASWSIAMRTRLSAS